MKKLFVFIIMQAILTTACGSYKTEDDMVFYGEKITKTYTETDESFRNPMKGFKPTRYIHDGSFSNIFNNYSEYVSIVQHVIKYTDLEATSADTVRKITDWSDTMWADLPGRNIKVIPRVVLVNDPGQEYWPGDLANDDSVQRWYTQEFKDRMAVFIAKLGEAWDNDPRVAAVETGLWGYWGEQHIWPETGPDGQNRIPPDVQKVFGDAFCAAFKNKKLMIRDPARFTDYDFGCYWDSFAKPEEDYVGQGIIDRDNWRGQMNSGETSFPFMAGSSVAEDPTGAFTDNARAAYIIDWIKKTHTSSLGWIAFYNQKDQSIKDNVKKMQKVFGYRFVVQCASYTKSAQQGSEISFEIEVKNSGCAPFYYKWPVEISLLNTAKTPVFTFTVTDADITKWLPGDDTAKIKGNLVLPQSLAKGTYILALAVLDPAGNKPSLRFANINYFSGGRMPLGTIGVGQDPDTEDLGAFDSLYNDNSLYYTVN